MLKAEKSANKKKFLPNENPTSSSGSNQEKIRDEGGINPTAVLCINKQIRNTKKKKYSTHFLKLLKNLTEVAKKENLKVVPFSAHITETGLHALIAECERRDESLATVIHQRYSKALQYRINRKPVFFFTLGFDNPNKLVALGKTRIQPQCYCGIHTHGFVLVTEKEHDGRTNEGQALRKSFKTFNGKYNSNSFKQQEVSITTASTLELYETQYTQEVSMQKQADYLAKNACQFDRQHKKDEKPYASSKAINNVGDNKEQRIKEKTKQWFEKASKAKKSQPKAKKSEQQAVNVVDTGTELKQSPPQSDSLKKKIAECNAINKANPSAITRNYTDEDIDKMINDL